MNFTIRSCWYSHVFIWIIHTSTPFWRRHMILIISLVLERSVHVIVHIAAVIHNCWDYGALGWNQLGHFNGSFGGGHYLLWGRENWTLSNIILTVWSQCWKLGDSMDHNRCYWSHSSQTITGFCPIFHIIEYCVLDCKNWRVCLCQGCLH